MIPYLKIGTDSKRKDDRPARRFKSDLPKALCAMERFGIPGVALSTCNRAEYYPLVPLVLTGLHARGGIGEVRIKEFLVEHFNFSLPEFEGYLYARSGRQCITQLFRVASGLFDEYPVPLSHFL